MIHDLMLPITATVGDENALSAAVAMASQFGAHLTVLELVNLPVPATNPWGLSPETAMQQIYADLRETGKRNAARLRTRLEKEGISWEVRVAEALLTEPSRIASSHARYADLAIVTAPKAKADDAGIAYRFFSNLLFESGRPVMVVPTQHSVHLPLRHVVVAWRPTRESTRALHDVLPLLAMAASIDVVTVEPGVKDMDDGDDPGVDIATHLARHDLKVNVVSLPLAGATVANTLLRHCAESGAQLLVAGGYGHSRLREWMLGGTTRELLQTSHLPILFSH